MAASTNSKPTTSHQPTTGKYSTSIAQNPILPSKDNHLLRFSFILSALILAILWTSISNGLAVLGGQLTASDAVTKVANNTGFNLSGKALFYRSNPAVVNADELNKACPNDSQDSVEYGCYLPSENKLYILDVADQDLMQIEYTTAAHEVLHAVWRKLDYAKKQTISDELSQVLKNNASADVAEVQNAIKFYGTDGQAIKDELHSFIGSEIPDDLLPAGLITYYNSYFSNRFLSVVAENNFNTAFDAKTNALSAQLSALNSQTDRITAYKIEWLDKIEQYMQRNLYYGDTTTYNKNVDAYNHNLKNYNKMVGDYETQRTTYNANVNSYNGLLSSFRPSASPIQTK